MINPAVRVEVPSLFNLILRIPSLYGKYSSSSCRQGGVLYVSATSSYADFISAVRNFNSLLRLKFLSFKCDIQGHTMVK